MRPVRLPAPLSARLLLRGWLFLLQFVPVFTR